MQPPLSRSPWDATVLTPRQGRPVTTAQAPWPAQALVRRSEALLPQFAAWYVRLRALPRRMRRALQRKLSLSLTGVALLLALGQGPLQAETITVDGTTCTLVDALTAANTDAAQGGCRAGSGPDTLVLEPPGSTVRLTRVHNTAYGPTGLPVVSSPITIAGQGGTIARASIAPAFRLLAVNSIGDLSLQNVTLTGGSALGDFPAGFGGGVFNYNGAVSIENSTITGNMADSGGGIANRGDGYEDDGATLTLVWSTIMGNTAAEDGGGLRNSVIDRDVTVTLTQSTISGNTAGFGGGLFNGSTEYGNGLVVTLIQSAISGNRADENGGGVSNLSSIALTQNTISDNTAGRDGGGVATYGFDAIVSLAQSTISGNAAGRDGGGMSNGYPSSLFIRQSTITGNTAGRNGGGVAVNEYYAWFDRSLVSGNLASTSPEIHVHNASVTANAFNLFGFNGNAGVTGFTPGPNDLVPDEPLSAILDPVLSDNGGPTETHALMPGSPAIDAIPATDPACTGTDQRGVLRPQGVGCDIGAVELGVAAGAFGTAVVGLQPQTVWCRNETTGQVVTFEPGDATSWDCEAAGLVIQPGDRVATRVRGPATGPGEVGGTVTGLQPSKAGCTNLTTGQHVEQRLFGDTTWSCQAMGLVAAPGERVQTSVRGRAGSEDHHMSGAQLAQ